MAEQRHELTSNPKLIDWILYNLHTMREQIKAIEPKTSTSIVVFSGDTTRNNTSGVERVALKRAALSSVIDVVELGLRTLHPEHRKVYRMKYRAGMTYKEIGQRLYVSDKTVERRVEETRTIIGQYLASVDPETLEEFMRFF